MSGKSVQNPPTGPGSSAVLDVEASVAGRPLQPQSQFQSQSQSQSQSLVEPAPETLSDPEQRAGATAAASSAGPEPLLRSVMPELDSLRGIAVLAVVFYHGFFWSANTRTFGTAGSAVMEATRLGWLGVNLFFVLSGFLITGVLIESRPRPHFFRRFYVRRALRILPAFYATILVLACLDSQSSAYLWMSALHLSNFAPLVGIPMTYAMFWSLAVEEHFYLVWPMVVRWVTLPKLMVCAAGIAVGVPALRWFMFRPDGPFAFLTWFVADGLAIGAVVAVFVRLTGQNRRHLAVFSSIACGVALIALAAGAPYGILTRTRPIGAAFMLTAAHVLFAGALGFVLLIGTSRFRGLVDRPVLRFYGEISYGLYLIHWLGFEAYGRLTAGIPALAPVSGRFDLLLFRFICALAGTTAVAFLSRRLFEERFLKMKTRLGG